MNLSPIQTRRSGLAEQVYQAICEHIIEGRLVPEERLREAQTAAALGVSRTPVREAFARLERQNLLRKEASGAYYVRQWDQKTLWEVATLRSVLEGLAMRLACNHFSAADYAALDEVIAQMDAAHARGDDDRLIALDIDFHSLLWAKTGHSLLQQALEEMKAQILYFMLITRPGDERDYPSSHRELVEIMKAGNAEKASQTIQEHIHTTAVRAVARWEQKRKNANPAG